MEIVIAILTMIVGGLVAYFKGRDHGHDAAIEAQNKSALKEAAMLKHFDVIAVQTADTEIAVHAAETKALIAAETPIPAAPPTKLLSQDELNALISGSGVVIGPMGRLP